MVFFFRKLICSCSLAAMCLVFAVETMAQDDLPPEEALEAARRGREFFEQDMYEEAIEQLLLAYDSYPTPALLHNIGRCYETLEDHCNAAGFFQRFLDEAEPVGDVRQEVIEAIAREEQLCEESRAPVEDPPDGPNENGDTVPPPPPPSRLPQILSWSLIGGGAALVLTGTILWGVSLSEKNDRDGICPQECNEPGYQESEDRRLRLGVAGDVLFFTGLAAAAAGVIYYFLRGRHEPTAVQMGPGFAGRGLQLSLRF